MSIAVIINGLPDNTNEYEDEEFLNADNRARDAIASLWEAGGRADNIADAVKGALEDAAAG